MVFKGELTCEKPRWRSCINSKIMGDLKSKVNIFKPSKHPRITPPKPKREGREGGDDVAEDLGTVDLEIVVMDLGSMV